MLKYLIDGGIFMWVILLASISGLAVIIEKGAVVGGGSDVTDDLITKMGKASDDQIKEVENAAKAQEQQDAQQNAQQSDQAATSTTEAAQ